MSQNWKSIPQEELTPERRARIRQTRFYSLFSPRLIDFIWFITGRGYRNFKPIPAKNKDYVAVVLCLAASYFLGRASAVDSQYFSVVAGSMSAVFGLVALWRLALKPDLNGNQWNSEFAPVFFVIFCGVMSLLVAGVIVAAFWWSVLWGLTAAFVLLSAIFEN